MVNAHLARSPFLAVVALVAAVAATGCAAPGTAESTSSDALEPSAADPCADPSKVFVGDLEIWTQQELLAASRFRCVQGSVNINTMFLGTKVRVAGLESVSGSFVVAASSVLEELAVDDLRSVGYAAEFGSASYPLPALRQLSLASLTRVAGVLNVSGTGLTEISVPRLRGAEQMNVTLNPSLRRLDVPALAEVEFVTVASNPSLAQCHVDALFAALASAGTDPERMVARDNGVSGSCR